MKAEEYYIRNNSRSEDTDDTGCGNVIKAEEHNSQSRANGFMDNICGGLGESSEMYNREPPEQFANGFIAGYGGSLYATYDTIRHPESAVASLLWRVLIFFKGNGTAGRL